MNFLKREEPVTDSHLESASQQKMASLVKALNDDELSLSWRSELNAKLAAADKVKADRKSAFRIYAWGSSLSLGVAAAVFAGVIMVSPKAPKASHPVADTTSFASELVKAHEESMVLASVSGTGAAARETLYTDDSYGVQDDLL